MTAPMESDNGRALENISMITDTLTTNILYNSSANFKCHGKMNQAIHVN